jgi:hypothetical protein
MHLIVPYAAPLSDEGRAAMSSLATPALDTLLRHWHESHRDSGDEYTLSMPHEHALARALGLAGADGCLPWAARLAAADGIPVGDRPWGLLSPACWRVGNDGVHLVDPALLDLDEVESRTLFDAVRPLFDSEGVTVAWGAPLRWYAAHEALRGLATASLDRAIGRNVERWLPRQPQARLMRRLQNEVQMLLHRLPLNEAREAAGALPVNSFWLSGCGTALPERGHDTRLDQRLRAPALRNDWAAWLTAWRALDAEAIAPLLAAAARGEPARLTLCGERGSVEFAPRPRPWWQRLAHRLTPMRAVVHPLLESL